MGNYYVCWRDKENPQKFGVVVGEGPMGDWCETAEVCSVFEAEDEGEESDFYVGDSEGNIAYPAKEEALEVLKWLKSGDHIISPWEIQMFELFVEGGF